MRLINEGFDLRAVRIGTTLARSCNMLRCNFEALGIAYDGFLMETRMIIPWKLEYKSRFIVFIQFLETTKIS